MIIGTPLQLTLNKKTFAGLGNISVGEYYILLQ